MRTRYIICVLFCLVSQLSQSQIIEGHISGTNFTIPSAQYTIVDNDPSSWYSMLSHKNWMTFEYLDDKNYYIQDLDFKIKIIVELKCYDKNGVLVATRQEPIELSHHKDISLQNKNRVFKEIIGSFPKIQYKLLSITTNLPNYLNYPIFRFNIYIKPEKFYIPVLNPTIVFNPTLPNSISSSHLNVSWNPILCDEYDFEWAFIDKNSILYAKYKGELERTKTYNADLTKELSFSRLTTALPQINKLPLIYAEGVVVYRIRAAYYDYIKNRLTSNWIESNSSGFQNVIEIVGHEKDFNWTSALNLTEEGKHKEMVSYFDGIQRDRQSVTFDNTKNKPIISETFYDFEGRKAVSILPAPSFEVGAGIKYFQSFNMNESTHMPYKANDLKYLTDCGVLPDRLDSNNGAAKYYSLSNPERNTKFHQFIPHAKGYPYASIQYTNDNTGRIQKQGGVGDSFQIGNNHDTKFLYGGAFRSEIDRLFGTDVGFSDHYFKQAVVDPNGQVSVTYLDMSGKTIATSLAGLARYSYLQPLETADSSEASDTILYPHSFMPNYSKKQSLGDFSFIMTGNQTKKFIVGLDSPYLSEMCVKEFCSDCYYDFNVRVQGDKCNNVLKETTYSNYKDLDHIDTSCKTRLRSIKDSFDLFMPIGNYTVNATISIPEKVIDFYTQRYLDSSNCLITKDSLIKKHLSINKPWKCITSCDSCKKYFTGSGRTNYINTLKDEVIKAGQTLDAQMIAAIEESADSAAASCKQFCQSKTSCDILYEFLIGDVSPGGQYAYYYDTLKKKLVQDTILFRPSYEPQTTSVITTWNLISLGIKKPNGGFYDIPKDLAEFNRDWDKKWASKLVTLHPEYCGYTYCLANNRDNIIDKLNETESLDEAISKGYFNFSSSDNGLTDLVGQSDKFNQSISYPAGGSPSFGWKMRNELSNIEIKDTTGRSQGFLNLYQYIIMLTNSNFVKYDSRTYTYVIDTAGFRKSNCGGLKNVFWSTYRDFVIYQFRKLYEKDMMSEKWRWEPFAQPKNGQTGQWVQVSWGCPDNRLKIGYCLPDGIKKSMKWFVDPNQTISPADKPYCTKTPRIYNTSEMEDNFKNNIAGSGSHDLKDSADKYFLAACSQNCESMADGWLNTLSDCSLKFGYFSSPGIWVSFPNPKKELRDGLIALCKLGCDYEHDFGASTAPNNKSIVIRGITCKSFQDVINIYKNSSLENCSADLIDFPRPYYIKPYYETRGTFNKIEGCVCENLDELGVKYGPMYSYTYDILGRILTKTLRPQFVQNLKNAFPEDSADYSYETINIIQESCNSKDSNCIYLPKSIVIPRQLDCRNRINCDEYRYGKLSFTAKYPNAIPHTYTYNKLLAGHINNLYGMNLSYYDYAAFELKCAPCADTCKNFRSEEVIVRIKGDCNKKIDTGRGGGGSGTGGEQGLRNPAEALASSDYTASLKYKALSSEEKSMLNPLLNLLSKANAFRLPNLNENTVLDMSSAFVPIPVDGFSSFFPGGGGLGCDFGTEIQVDENGDCYQCMGWMDPIAQVCYPTFPPGGCPNCIPFKIYFAPEFCDSIKKAKDTAKTCDTCYKLIVYICGDENTGTKRDTVKIKLSDAECNIRPPKEVDTVDTGGGTGGGGTGGGTGSGGGSTGGGGWGGAVSIREYPHSLPSTSGEPTLFYTINPQKKEDALQALFGKDRYLMAKDILQEISQNPPSTSYSEDPRPSPPPSDGGSGGGNNEDDPCDDILYDKPLSPRLKVKNPCVEQMTNLAISSALYEWEKQRDNAIKGFRQRYIEKCLNDANGYVILKGKVNEFHHTLYYYGQDGNLLKTVPPAGVQPMAANLLDGVQTSRISKGFNAPTHTLPTDYKYNSLNQVIEQTTPDGGTSKFAYDELGRLIISQNAKQAASQSNDWNIVSYTIYDKFSRIIESGEIAIDIHFLNSPSFLNYFNNNIDFVSYASYLSDLNLFKAKSSTKLRYVTRTYYDKKQFNNIQSEFNGQQQNLKNRIASITLDTLDIDKGIDATSYHSALHYSYDILGNVQKLVSENKVTPHASQQFKLVEYDYDLASGKVNKVMYQKSKPDQFFYRYDYDAENKLLAAYTSTNDLEWERDAQYEYYTHGPVARHLVGEREVQGIDYAYTLQGWLKSVNANGLNPQLDMGEDALAGSVQENTATDAVAFSLQYFKKDYEQIGRRTNPILNSISTSMTDQPLFNGNISSAVVANLAFNTSPTMGYKYGYDQLHRLVKMDAFQNAQTAVNDYQERIKYDANGNILKYLRNRDGGVLMDSLTYNYDAIKRNQLKYVRDAVGDLVSPLDIDHQTNLDNYLYDAIGNLIEDKQAKLKISWTPAGKIDRIQDDNKKQILTFGYDPMGHRVWKKVSSTVTNAPALVTYYTRDAQGNTLAVYDNHQLSEQLVYCDYDGSSLMDAVDMAVLERGNCSAGMDVSTCNEQVRLGILNHRPTNDSCLLKAYAIIAQSLPPCNLDPQYIGLVQQFYNDFATFYQGLDPADRADFLNQKIADYEANFGITPMDIDCFREKVTKSIGMNQTAFDDYFVLLGSAAEITQWKADLVQSIKNMGITYTDRKDMVYTDSLYWQEQHLYGSARLGMALPKREVTRPNVLPYTEWLVGRQYELTNHLGNVLATIKDEKKQIFKNGVIDHYEPMIVSATDYYPFGMPMPNRTYSLSSSKYRFGFNGIEHENDMYGEGNAYIAEFGGVDTRIGRRFNVDPKPDVSISPYATFANNPIIFSDVKLDTPSHTPQTGDCEGCPIAQLKDGDYFSDVQHQTYTANFSGVSQADFNKFKTQMSQDPGKIINNGLASYDLIDRDGSYGVTEGDHFDIDIAGPDNGSVVVSKVATGKYSLSVTVKTLKGHTDAGQNTFSVSYDPKTKVMTWQTSNISRTNDDISQGVGGGAIGRPLQKMQWVQVIKQVQEFVQKPVMSAQKVISEYDYNDWTNKVGKLEYTETEDITGKFKK